MYATAEPGGGPGCRRLLSRLETQAAHRVRAGQLETNPAFHEAISMYRAAGYRQVPRSATKPTPGQCSGKTIAP